jgi:hypothetical protein
MPGGGNTRKFYSSRAARDQAFGVITDQPFPANALGSRGASWHLDCGIVRRDFARHPADNVARRKIQMLVVLRCRWRSRRSNRELRTAYRVFLPLSEKPQKNALRFVASEVGHLTAQRRIAIALLLTPSAER